MAFSDDPPVVNIMVAVRSVTVKPWYKPSLDGYFFESLCCCVLGIRRCERLLLMLPWRRAVLVTSRRCVACVCV